MRRRQKIKPFKKVLWKVRAFDTSGGEVGVEHVEAYNTKHAVALGTAVFMNRGLLLLFARVTAHRFRKGG
jgi:uncharacterized protein (DUF2062 family)